MARCEGSCWSEVGLGQLAADVEEAVSRGEVRNGRTGRRGPLAPGASLGLVDAQKQSRAQVTNERGIGARLFIHLFDAKRHFSPIRHDAFTLTIKTIRAQTNPEITSSVIKLLKGCLLTPDLDGAMPTFVSAHLVVIMATVA